MKEYEAGRESSILTYILTGQKTIEVRLNKGKFATFQPGDHVKLREDIYQNGKVIKQIHNRAVTEIVKINHYRTFRDLFETEGLINSLPYVDTTTQAIEECRKFYSEKDEKKYGVLAIHFQIIEIL